MAKMMKTSVRAAALGATFALAACGGEGLFPKTSGVGGHSNSGEQSSGESGRYHVGKPYTANGMTFTPREESEYSAVGIASWYGDKYHGRRTANGEVYDMYRLTAAHPTLQLPSVIRVTNLENGRQIDLRVNDRGPFVPGRIIDVSKVAADRLGFKAAGVAQVRIDLLPGESRRLKQAMLAKGRGDRAVAMAAPAQPAAAIGIRERPFEFRQVSSRPSGVAVRHVHQAPTATPRAAPPPLTAQPLPPVMPHASAPPPRATVVAERAVINPRADTAPVPGAALAPRPAAPTSTVERGAPLAADGDWIIEALDPISPAAPQVAAALALTPVAPATPSDGRVYVQAGAFGDVAKAEHIRDRLAAIGPSLVEPVMSGGRSLYRVRVGPFATKGAASTTRAQIAAAGFPDALTVAKQDKLR